MAEIEYLENSEYILSGENIVYFGPEKWDGMWRNRHQLLTRFARSNKVVYVEPVVGLRFQINEIRKSKNFQKTLSDIISEKRIEAIQKNLYIYKNPGYIPVSGRYPLNTITWSLWINLLNKKLKTLGIHNPIIWISRPGMKKYIGRFKEKMSIYHIVDEYSAYVKLNSEKQAEIKKKEKDLMKNVDLVIVVSKNLYQAKCKYNESTYIVSNGVDFEAYDKAIDSRKTIPKDLAYIPKPVIGYSGLISIRLDLDMIYQAALNKPTWSYVLIGTIDNRGCEDMLNKLKNLENVHLLGLKSINEVPIYVKTFDVCMVPYAINSETKNLSPLKLYDYMATGKPIVTTNIPFVLEFADIVYIAESKKKFIELIKIALKEKNNIDLNRARKLIASHNTWDHRVKHLSKLIESKLAKRISVN